MRSTRWKNSILLPVMAAFLLLLSGCRKEMAEETIYLGLPGMESAVFTGTVEDGLGEGTLTFADWVYTGSFRVQTEEESAALLTGAAEDFPWTLVFSGEAIPGRYTGELQNAVPVGEGVFRGDNGMTYIGEIFGEAPVQGEVTALPLTITHQGSRYTGLYDGAVTDGLAGSENVTFEACNAAGQRLCWEGGVAAGEITGTGRLTCDRLLTQVEGAERMGSYEGEAVDGLPEGAGAFTSVDDKGVRYTYEGAWQNGLMEGVGELRYEAADRYVRSGHFTAGYFTPDWIEALSVLGTAEPAFTLTEEQIAFLEAHPELWEGGSRTNFYDSEYKKEVDRSLTLWSVFNDPSTIEEPRWMSVNSLKVLNAYSGPAFPGGAEITRITAADRNYDKVFYLVVPGNVEGIGSNQWVSFICLPLCMSAYTTVLGSQHSCLAAVVGDLTITG